MDFSFTEEQDAVAEAAQGVFEGRATVERVKEVEATDDRVDHELWAELAKANLLGLVVPEAHGGSGLGVIEACLVLQAQGATVAPVPLWPTTFLGALPVARHGTDAQQAALLPGVVAGDTVLTAAVESVGAETVQPATVTATPDGSGGFTLAGHRSSVPAGHVAHRILVPAATPEGEVVVAIVDPSDSEATVEAVRTTDREVRAHLTLDGVAVTADDVLGGPDADGTAIVADLVQHAAIGLCAILVGLCDAALRRTAEYSSTREQFGRPLSTNQGVAMRAGDAYIDLSAMRNTLWQAAWRLSEGIPAAEEVGVARWWASEGGHRVVHTTQHLHGGMGADVDYPIHRYFLWALELGHTLGTGSRVLVELGRTLAASAKARAGSGSGSGEAA